MALRSKLQDKNVGEIQAFVDAGLNNHEIAAKYDVSEAAIRRFRSKHDIKAPEVAPVPKETPPSVLERAERAAAQQQTLTDRLTDDLDAAKEENRRLTAVVKQLRGRERVEDRIVDQLASASSRPYVNPLTSIKQTKVAQTRGQHFVALVSDAHGGEYVDPDQALGVEYNWDICVRRLEYIRDTIVKYADLRPYTIEKLWVPVLGDMLSGDIHDELRITNTMTLPEQSIEMGRVLYQMGADLSEYFPQVEFVVMPGNHPRLYKKPSMKNKFASWEYVMGKYVEGLSEASGIKNFTVDVPRDLVKVINVQGKRIGLMHGDGVKSASFAGIPFYGLRQQREAVQALMSQTDQARIDMFCIGHFHQYVYWSGECDIIINGAIKGGDEYSIATRLSMNPPEQVLLEFHPEHGLTSQNRINLGHIN